MFRKFLWLPIVISMLGCSTPKPEHPSLTPLTASELLRNNTTAQNRLLAIKRQDRTCEYKLDVPADQAAHADWVQIDHIVTCSGNSHPAAYDASIEFQYNKTEKKWQITRIGG